MPEMKLALGLMSGTSMDGIDAALIETDGEHVAATGLARTFPYPEAFRARLRAVLGTEGDPAIARELTDRHAEAVAALLAEAGIPPARVAVLGFHGHTVLHRPGHGITRQIGDGALLARLTGIDTVSDFRSADVAAGGEGAPLAPAYHRALAEPLAKPLAVLNVGGVANVTWIGHEGRLLAFDTGPGNALIDEWALRHTGRPIDTDGALAGAGKVDPDELARLLQDPYFARPAPKSLDRLDFDMEPVARLSPADGAATLTAFTAAAAARGARLFPVPVGRWLVTGGGRHNPTLMGALTDMLDAPVGPVEAVGWNGDALEAQAFGFLAVRHLRGLPLSFPGTTGVPRPMPGGRLDRAPGREG